jgi:hypothetical protein
MHNQSDNENQPTRISLDLTDPDIFGNDAGEDEKPEVLASYFVDKPEFNRFFNPEQQFAVIRARKGIGKSALLAKVAFDVVSKHNAIDLVIQIKGSDLTGLGEFSSSDPSFLINQWQQVICSRINIEIGKTIRWAFSDSSITMVESSELAGFKNKNIVSALVDRLNLKIKGVVELEPHKYKANNDTFLLQRYRDKHPDRKVWVFIDDVDATFKPDLTLKISTFFSACRKLVADIHNLNIRACVRTDVWTTIKRLDESLDKCEQYISEIHWSHQEAKRILGKKLLSYIKRKHPHSNVANWNPQWNQDRILRFVFEKNIPWGKNSYPPERPFHILSSGRPRWAGQLGRMAGTMAVRLNLRRINVTCLSKVLREFGQYRLDELYREHEHQFPRLKYLIESFANGPSIYSTTELVSKIEQVFLAHEFKTAGIPEIDGKKISSEMDVAHLLFKISFICGRDTVNTTDPLCFIRFEDRPELLTNRINPDDNLKWEIHPSYRSYLNIKKRDLDDFI